MLEDVESLEEQREILMNYHEGKTNHRGILETYQKLKEKYYWSNIYNDIQKYINHCDICLYIYLGKIKIICHLKQMNLIMII